LEQIEFFTFRNFCPVMQSFAEMEKE